MTSEVETLYTLRDKISTNFTKVKFLTDCLIFLSLEPIIKIFLFFMFSDKTWFTNLVDGLSSKRSKI